MVTLQDVSKTYSGHRGVSGISIAISPGEVVGLVGPNGAGKSTTIRMIAGTLEPDTGTISIFGHDIGSARCQAQALMGYLPEHAPLYGDMIAQDYLDFLLRARGIQKPSRAALIAQAAERAAITSVLSHRIETLSKGFARRVALAGALAHDPQVLILDEPTDGLDPNQKRVTHAMIRAMAPGRIILISTHQLDEAASLCSRLILLDQGQIKADEPPQAFAARTQSGRMEDAFFALTLHGPAGLEPVP